MCGIVGLLDGRKTTYDDTLRAMVQAIGYRGPDDQGFYDGGIVGLGHARLSIIDPENGRQPASSEDGGVIVVFNGEIYNFHALASSLTACGHRLENQSDTAVLPHLYEEYGLDMFQRLSGQFAIAIWDKRKQALILARDRYGEKPLFYAERTGNFAFGSEAKAIFKSGLISPVLSPRSLGHIFTYWTPLGDESAFEGVHQLPPGSFLVYKNGQTSIQRYWAPDLSQPDHASCLDAAAYEAQLEALLIQSVRARMVADVPVSFYVSGGLDSALVTSIAARETGLRLNTFSLTFDDKHFDESAYQTALTRALGTNHRSVRFESARLPSLLSEVVWHTETPVLRSGPFPMYVLAGLVRDSGIKVVLSGEGADELFGGYDLFREVKIRQFAARLPESTARPRLYGRVNAFVPQLSGQPSGGLRYFYGSADNADCFASHQTRWRLGQYSRQFFAPDFRAAMDAPDGAADALSPFLPDGLCNWPPLARAQAIETATLFSDYLLSSQGDRVSMGQGVECRYPFLDETVATFAARLPDTMKIRGLNEKYLLKQLARKYVPEPIQRRQKFPYRAPIDIAAIMASDEARHFLSDASIRQYGVFNADAVARFIALTSGRTSNSERDCMLFMGLLTTQALCERFIG